MKLVVQNGGGNPLSRKNMEAVLIHVPSSLLRGCNTLVLCGSLKSSASVAYYPKDGTVELTGSANTPKIEVLEELLVALTVIQEKGIEPSKLSVFRREEIISLHKEVLSKCIGTLV